MLLFCNYYTEKDGMTHLGSPSVMKIDSYLFILLASLTVSLLKFCHLMLLFVIHTTQKGLVNVTEWKELYRC